MTSFNLLKLPGLAFHQVIEIMGIMEIIKLTMCSNRANFLVKLGKHKVNELHIHVKKDSYQLEIKRTKDDFCDINMNIGDKKDENIDIGKVSEWYQNEYSQILNFKPTDSLEDVISVSQSIRSCFKITLFTWKIHMESMIEISSKQFLSTLPLDDCQGISIIGGEIDKETIDWIMDTLDLEKKLTIDSKLPVGFKHKNAFRFKSCNFTDAHWVTIDNLVSLRGNSSIKLGSTNLDNFDLNHLLNYWTILDHDIFSTLTLELKDGIAFRKNVVFDGLRRVFMQGAPCPTFYLLARNKEKKRIIGRVQCDKQTIEIKFLEDSYVRLPLELLEKKEQLENRYAELERRENQAIQAEDRRKCFNEDAQKIRKEKVNIEEEFKEIVQQLLAKQTFNFSVNLSA